MRSLVAVADAGAITEAANRLGLTQPALTRRIQLLEEEFGAALLERSRSGAVLTELGELVVQEAKVLIDRYENLKSQVTSLRNLEGGSVRIGGGATAVSFVLPQAIAQFQNQHPDVHFHVKEASSREVAQDVADGRLELGIVTQPVRTAGLEIEPVLDDEIVLVAALGHELAKKSRVELRDLDGCNIVAFEGDSAIRHIVDGSLREAGIEVNVVMELRSIPAILRMVITTGSLAFVSRLGLEGQSLVKAIDVEGLQIRRALALAHRKGHQLSPAAAAFSSALFHQ